MRRTLIVVVALLGLVAGACGGGEEPASVQAEAETEAPVVPASPPADCTDVTDQKTVKVELVDATTLFPGCLIVTTDQEFEVANVDPFVGHTWTIGEAEFHRTPFILNSDRVPGGETVTIGSIGSGVEPGGYPLFCIYHPLMKGEIYIQ
ncbi:MAG: hypothetical protein ACRDH6_07440 [Actinomycetota bacterium]